jgi:hypothetical protein
VGFQTDKGVKTKQSGYTAQWKAKFPEATSLEQKAEATGVPLKFIKENSGDFKKTELFQKLPKKMMWGTFNVILQYLWDNNKIAIDKNDFVVYIWSPEAGKIFKDKKRY